MLALKMLHNQLTEAIEYAEANAAAYTRYYSQLRRARKLIERAQKALDKLEELGARGEARTVPIPYGEEVKSVS